MKKLLKIIKKAQNKILFINNNNNKMKKKYYISVNNFCSCIINKLDDLFTEIPNSISNFNNYKNEDQVILDIRILKNSINLKNDYLEIMNIKNKHKNFFNKMGYKRFNNDENENILLSINNSKSILTISKDIEKFIEKTFPLLNNKTFFNYLWYYL